MSARCSSVGAEALTTTSQPQIRTPLADWAPAAS